MSFKVLRDHHTVRMRLSPRTSCQIRIYCSGCSISEQIHSSQGPMTSLSLRRVVGRSTVMVRTLSEKIELDVSGPGETWFRSTETSATLISFYRSRLQLSYSISLVEIPSHQRALIP